jgi:UDP-glucose:(heptosyl)LPS alpha-1,3-glucosyltransferase
VKIALVHKRLDFSGGTERDLFRTAEGLRDCGHDVHLFCGQFRVSAPRGVTMHRIPVLRWGKTAQLLSLASRAPPMIAQAHCNLVLGFDRIPGCDVARSGGGTHRGYLSRLAEEGGPGRILLQKLSSYHRAVLALERRQFACARLKKIIAVSSEVKRDIMANYAVKEDRIAVLYNGVDARRFHPSRRAESALEVRRRWKIPAAAPLVLFVGSGFRRKGLDRLIKIWSMPDLASAYLLVVGSDARLRQYRLWADSLAPGRIVFAGRQDQVENYYGAADVVALPSLQEAFGNVVLEALASGVAVLVSRSVGASELLTGRLADGIVERPEDERELSARLAALLERAKEPAETSAARSIGEAYSWQRHFQQLDALLCEVATGSAHVP